MSCLLFFFTDHRGQAYTDLLFHRSYLAGEKLFYSKLLFRSTFPILTFFIPPYFPTHIIAHQPQETWQHSRPKQIFYYQMRKTYFCHFLNEFLLSFNIFFFHCFASSFCFELNHDFLS